MKEVRMNLEQKKAEVIELQKKIEISKSAFDWLFKKYKELRKIKKELTKVKAQHAKEIKQLKTNFNKNLADAFWETSRRLRGKYEKELTELDEYAEEIEKELQKVKEELQKAEKEKEELKRKLVAATKEKKELENQVATAIKEKEEVEKKLAVITEEKNELEKKIKETGKTIPSKDEQNLDELKKENLELRKQLAAFYRGCLRLQTMIEEKDARIRELGEMLLKIKSEKTEEEDITTELNTNDIDVITSETNETKKLP